MQFSNSWELLSGYGAKVYFKTLWYDILVYPKYMNQLGKSLMIITTIMA